VKKKPCVRGYRFGSVQLSGTVIWNGYEIRPYTRPCPIGTEPQRDESGEGEFGGDEPPVHSRGGWEYP
jgi:hypothetical protein